MPDDGATAAGPAPEEEPPGLVLTCFGGCGEVPAHGRTLRFNGFRCPKCRGEPWPLGISLRLAGTPRPGGAPKAPAKPEQGAFGYA